MKALSYVARLSTLLALLVISAAAPAAERTIYIQTDALGSPIAATDTSGNLLWREKYLPYGETRLNQGTSTNLWYTGHFRDIETGLLYAGARYYDPMIGRFMAVDPVGFNEDNPHSFNRYAYGNNNPYKYADPDGQAPTPVDAFFTSFTVGEFLAVGALNIYGRLTGDRGLTEVTSAAMLPAAGAVAQDLAGLVSPVPGASGTRRAAQAADRAADAAQNGDLLFRRGARDSQKLLENQARAAEEASNIGIHGVSVSTSPKAKPGQVVRCGSRAACEDAGFKVHKTGSDPDHYTVELPKPVTPEVTRKFNDLFQ